MAQLIHMNRDVEHRFIQSRQCMHPRRVLWYESQHATWCSALEVDDGMRLLLLGAYLCSDWLCIVAQSALALILFACSSQVTEQATLREASDAMVQQNTVVPWLYI